MEAKLGIAPIAWWNDDLPELSGDITLEECLSEARQAGFSLACCRDLFVHHFGTRIFAHGSGATGAERKGAAA